ncbi:hypothetical protein OAP56_04430 [Rickettsiaceae bacterium]|nr:hypothetical protein [Rickettsiaceae bacterium]
MTKKLSKANKVNLDKNHNEKLDLLSQAEELLSTLQKIRSSVAKSIFDPFTAASRNVGKDGLDISILKTDDKKKKRGSEKKDANIKTTIFGKDEVTERGRTAGSSSISSDRTRSSDISSDRTRSSDVSSDRTRSSDVSPDRTKSSNVSLDRTRSSNVSPDVSRKETMERNESQRKSKRLLNRIHKHYVRLIPANEKHKVRNVASLRDVSIAEIQSAISKIRKEVSQVKKVQRIAQHDKLQKQKQRSSWVR